MPDQIYRFGVVELDLSSNADPALESGSWANLVDWSLRAALLAAVFFMAKGFAHERQSVHGAHCSKHRTIGDPKTMRSA